MKKNNQSMRYKIGLPERGHKKRRPCLRRKRLGRRKRPTMNSIKRFFISLWGVCLMGLPSPKEELILPDV
jgi:hypothetical protein